MALIEESGKKLNPEFDTAEEHKGLANKIILHKASPKRLFKLGSNYILEIGHLAKNLPNTVNNTLSKLEDGEITNHDCNSYGSINCGIFSCIICR